MEDNDLRLTCLKLSLELVIKKQELMEPWERANTFFNYVKYGSIEGPPKKKPGPAVGTKYKKK